MVCAACACSINRLVHRKSIERVTGAGRLTALAVATIQRSDQPASCPEVIALATSSEFFLTPACACRRQCAGSPFEAAS